MQAIRGADGQPEARPGAVAFVLEDIERNAPFARFALKTQPHQLQRTFLGSLMGQGQKNAVMLTG
jgi:hypothetical protein